MATPRHGPMKAAKASQCIADQCEGNVVTASVVSPNKTRKGSKRILLAQLRRIGYHIGERIGDGSYSKVYYAEHKSNKHDHKWFSNIPIACKIIDRHYTSSSFLEKFLPRELSIVKRLTHPHIVLFHSIVEIGPFMCCFMDFCPYGDLLDRIRYRGRVSAERSRQFFSQIASAVQYLHAMGIAHRDVKCENVLIHSRNCVKLTDFGFSRAINFDRKGGLVLSDTYCGSAAYAAPEVLKGIAYDPRLYDMWSMGCVLYIMVTGVMPFDDGNIAAIIRKQEHRELVYALETPVADDVKTIIGGLLEPNVGSRTTIEALMHEPWVMLV